MKLIRRDSYQLSTGRIFSANRGLIGLSPHDSTVSEGYDGHVFLPCYMDQSFVDDALSGLESPWTLAECEELRAFMIALWQAWEPTKDRE